MAILTICRGTKSGGAALAECVAEELGYPVVALEVLQHAAEELGVRPDDVGEKLEEKPGLFGRPPLITKIYVAAVQAALAEHAAEGNLVYHGLAGGLLLRGVDGVLCTRLIAPMEVRVQAIRSSDGLSREDAERYIREVDEARARWVKMIYGEDVNDPSLYDQVINLASFTISEACEVLAETARQPPFEMTPERIRNLEDFRVGTQVRLALLEDLGTQTLDLGATAVDGKVVITGEAPMMPTGEVGNRITEIAQTVPGVQEVRLAIQWFDPYP